MSYNLVDPVTGDLTQVAGRGRAEYGASTVRQGTIEIPGQTAQSFQTLSVTFTTPMPDANYQVTFKNRYGSSDVLNIEWQTKNGFSFFVYNASTSATGTHGLDYTAFKLYSDVEYSNIVNSMPANASASNKLATRDDIVTRHNFSITGTADTIADTKALVNHIVTLDVGTYAGEFKRSGVTFGSYRLTYFIDGIYSKSVSGIVTYSINVDTDATYQISYVEDIEHGTPPVWKIEKLTADISLSGAVDCNALTEPGLYTASASAVSALVNSPINDSVQLSGGFSILVTKTNTGSAYYGMQMFIPYGSDSPYIRKSYYLNGQHWDSWQRLATNKPASVTRMSPIAGGFAVFNLPENTASARIVLLDKYGAPAIPGSCNLTNSSGFTSETDSMWYASITDINTAFSGAAIANGDAISVKIEITY